MGGLSFPRKPWAYGDRVSHPVYRYSCLHKLFRGPGALLTVRRVSATECSPTERFHSRSFGATLKPRYIFGAGSLDQ